MTAETLDLTGAWDGVYHYKDVPDAGPSTPFLATIKETNGAFTGTVIEPHEFKEGTVSAIIHGRRRGRDVSYAKDYETDDEDYQATVQYTGTLSDDGQIMTGAWSIEHWSGTFEMSRSPEAAEIALIKDDAAVEF